MGGRSILSILTFCPVTVLRQEDAWLLLTIYGNSPDVCTGAKEEGVITKPELQGMIPEHMLLLQPTLRAYVSLYDEMKGAGAHIAFGSSMGQVPEWQLSRLERIFL